MKNSLRFISATIAILPLLLGVQSSNAESKTRFVCGEDKGEPATLAILPDGTKAPIIRYVSGAFTSAGFSDQKRCDEISARFQYFNDLREIDFMTVGKINGQNVICVTRKEGADCSRDLKSEGLLITVRPGVNPNTTLSQLINVRLQAGSELSENPADERGYVNMQCLIDSGKSQENYDSCVKGNPKFSSPSSVIPNSNVVKPAASAKPHLW